MAYHELRITIPPAAREDLIRILAQKGSLGFLEEEEVLVAYFPEHFNIRSLVRELDLMNRVLIEAGVQKALPVTSELLPDMDWNESWKKGFKPLDVGQRFTILPPWEIRNPERVNLIVDPGMAFGTGHHETTRSCLVLMEKHDKRIRKERFLDLGAGTGLLAIAASKLGYREVLAVDIDPLAIDATRKNMELNKVANLDIREGSINAVSGTFDCITANILSGVLILLASSIADRLSLQGIGILSGILAEQADEVIAEMEKAGLKPVQKYPDGKWMSLVVSR